MFRDSLLLEDTLNSALVIAIPGHTGFTIVKFINTGSDMNRPTAGHWVIWDVVAPGKIV